MQAKQKDFFFCGKKKISIFLLYDHVWLLKTFS